MNLAETVKLLQRLKKTHPTCNKAELEKYFVDKCSPLKERSVYVGQGFALRFCEANTPSFSNVVLSLSTLRKYDSLPLAICVVRPDRLEFRLANATFLRRIRHSSHGLRVDNIRGSFLGHDILDRYDDVPNSPEYFDELIAAHREFSWDENVARLVEATNAIVARSTRFQVNAEVLAILLGAPGRAAAAFVTPGYQAVERRLAELIEQRREALLHAGALDNVNIRGNTIEQIITGGVNAHRLDDLTFELEAGSALIVDVKTKLLDRVSAPKAYNIDKMLSLLANPQNVFSFFFVGLDVASRVVRTRLVSIFDPSILRATRIQVHWAGRASRGVTQLAGDLAFIFLRDFRPSIDVPGGQALLKQFVER